MTNPVYVVRQNGLFLALFDGEDAEAAAHRLREARERHAERYGYKWRATVQRYVLYGGSSCPS